MPVACDVLVIDLLQTTQGAAVDASDFVDWEVGGLESAYPSYRIEPDAMREGATMRAGVNYERRKAS